MVSIVTLYAIASFIVFVVGLSSGWYVSNHGFDITGFSLQTAVAVVVSIIWAVSIVAEIVIPAYTVSVLVHGIMGAVVGYLFSEDGLTINIGGD